MSAEDQDGAIGHIIDGFDKNRATPPQLLYYVGVMDNFMVYVYRRAIGFQCQLHNVHGAHHARAEPSGSNPQ